MAGLYIMPNGPGGLLGIIFHLAGTALLLHILISLTVDFDEYSSSRTVTINK